MQSHHIDVGCFTEKKKGDCSAHHLLSVEFYFDHLYSVSQKDGKFLACSLTDSSMELPGAVSSGKLGSLTSENGQVFYVKF